MLTQAQQKVKQELEELKVNGILHDETVTVSPVFVQPISKWPFILIGLLAIGFILCYFAVNMAVPSTQSIQNYLSKELELNQKSASLLADVTSKITSDPQQAINAQQKLWDKANDLSAPAGFKEHHQDFLVMMEHRYTILSHLAVSSPLDHHSLNRYQIELEVKQELALDSLIRAFDKQDIEYQIREDGSIQYWINQKPFEYNINHY
ncbi:hypothetical protein [Neobacillus sp. Marseille-QA0830]